MTQYTPEMKRAWRKAHPDTLEQKAHKAAYDVVYYAKIKGPVLKRDERKRHLWRAYGLTPETFIILCEKQNNQCALCFQPLDFSNGWRVHIDHIPGTKIVRGVLCSNCNTTSGKIAKLGAEWLARTVLWLKL